MTSLEQTLAEHFGFTTFRAGQAEVMDVLLEGRSALAVFPTGSGKSLCYQLPALLLEGLTLVVSPLIALMKDQVEALQSRGIAAERLDSTLEASEVLRIYDAMSDRSLRLLYVAPERLANEGFLQKLRTTDLAMLAIDEAHCISEWGHNFRPDYLKLAGLARDFAIPRVLCLTATATPKVSADIRQHFAIRETDHIQTGFRRPNLSYHVTPCTAAERIPLLVDRLKSRPTGATVVYVTLQSTAESVAGELTRAGLSAKAYHAGLPDDYRAEVQDDFMQDAFDIVVATIAFGMGIDKSNIRGVYHYNLPKSLENYAQETGRSGRDGEPAHCEILACGDDLITLQNFVYGDTPSSQALKSLAEHLLLHGDTFSISRYDLSNALDIRPLVIATALTYLELNGAVLARGPFYAGMRWHFVEPRERLLKGHPAEHQRLLNGIFDAAKSGWKWHAIQVETVADSLDVPADTIRRALNELAEMGDIVLQPSGLRHAYELPETPRALGGVIEELQQLFARREDGEIDRLNLVIDLAETRECLTRYLLEYFGDTLAENCGQCGNCLNPDAAPAALPCSLVDEVTYEQVEQMRDLQAEGHVALKQPRQLARFLCGISSPAASRKRLNRHDAFGALAQVPFQTVLRQTETML